MQADTAWQSRRSVRYHVIRTEADVSTMVGSPRLHHFWISRLRVVKILPLFARQARRFFTRQRLLFDRIYNKCFDLRITAGRNRMHRRGKILRRRKTLALFALN